MPNALPDVTVQYPMAYRRTAAPKNAIASIATTMRSTLWSVVKTNVVLGKLGRGLFFAAACLILLADVVFIAVATKFNLLIVIPSVLSAAFLAAYAAYRTVLLAPNGASWEEIGS